MTGVALRAVMAMAERNRDEEVGAALFELLLATPLLAIDQGGSPAFTDLPDGQVALPLFLDQAALERFAPGVRGHTCTAQQAASVAMGSSDVWLVLEPGSVPGGQTIGRASVELLSRGAHPFADAMRSRHAFVDELCEAGTRGQLDAELKARAQSTRIITLGSAPGATSEATAAPSLELGSVRGPDGSSLCPLWPTMTGCFVFMPGPVRRITMPLSRLVEAALQTGRGLVAFRAQGAPATIRAEQLVAWWQ